MKYLDDDMMIMDVELANNQVTIMSSEKAYFEVQVDEFGQGVRSEGKGSCSAWQTRE